MLKTLAEAPPNPQIITDIGAGSGFLALWSAHKNLPRLVQVVDVSSRALTHIQEAFERQGIPSPLKILLGDVRERTDLDPADIVMCNPPYVPIIEPKRDGGREYGGTDLLEHLLYAYKHYLRPSGRMYIVLSNLSLTVPNINSQITKLLSEGAAFLRSEMRVPFKVVEITNDPQWLNYLIQECGLEEAPESGYRYWHRIFVFELRDELVNQEL